MQSREATHTAAKKTPEADLVMIRIGQSCEPRRIQKMNSLCAFIVRAHREQEDEAMVNPDRNTVLALLDYNPETGIFTHKTSRSGVKAGSKAGTPSSVSGYIQIRLPSGRYMAHRLAWLVTHNEMPDAEIDHINGNPADNRIENLRRVSQTENKRNRSKQKNNSSSTTGVRFHHSKSAWEAYIGVSGKKVHLGDFESFELALAARRSAEKIYGFHENHGRKAPD